MLRTKQTLFRLVRQCLKVGPPSIKVPRLSIFNRIESSVNTPIIRWYSLDHQPLAPAPTIESAEDVAKERKLKILQMEASVLRQEGRRVPDPDRMKPDQWEHLLSLDSKSARTKYYAFLWSVEMKRESEKVWYMTLFGNNLYQFCVCFKIKKEKKREEGVVLKEERLKELSEQEHIVYSLSHTSMFLRIYDATMNHWHNNK